MLGTVIFIILEVVIGIVSFGTLDNFWVGLLSFIVTNCIFLKYTLFNRAEPETKVGKAIDKVGKVGVSVLAAPVVLSSIAGGAKINKSYEKDKYVREKQLEREALLKGNKNAAIMHNRYANDAAAKISGDTAQDNRNAYHSSKAFESVLNGNRNAAINHSNLIKK